MNKKYKETLILLAEEVYKLNQPIITTEKTAKNDIRWNREQFISKLNYLLGYIMALQK